MKIAIMTQPLGKNYGGIMQAYALQIVLRKLGYKPVTINYGYHKPSFIYQRARQTYRIALKLTGKRKAPVNLEKHLNYLIKNNLDFINSHISQSEYINTTSNLKKHFKENNYDAVIVGSDQTWRPKYSPNIYNFYLEFIKNNRNVKKIAYATSFGVDQWEYSKKETRKCARLAQLFDTISVREESGVVLCDKYLKANSTVTLDPTLLLNKKEYINLLKGKDYTTDKSEGVFTYFLDSSMDKENIACIIANELSTYTFKNQAKSSLNHLDSNKLSDYKIPELEKWLSSFYNAEFIITDSFHGCVFSIIFNKPFIAIANKRRGLARFKSLLSLFSLNNRLLIDPKNIETAIGLIEQDINWDKVNKALEVHKKVSYDFLASLE